MSAHHTVGFLTGQSRPGCCALSPEQQSFLTKLAAPGRRLLSLNFPYSPSAPFRPVSLIRASWHNFIGYYLSRRRSFADTYRDNVTAVIRQTPRTFFLVGSSGLELFNNLRLSADDERRCTLICYGPVARRRPHHATTVMVQSSRDFLSRMCFPDITHSLRCDHLGYLLDPQFLRLCQARLSAQPSPPCLSISV